MTQTVLEIEHNEPLALDTFELALRGEVPPCAPGQFAEIAVPGKFLRRPFSVCRSGSGSLTVIYRVSGGGTEMLSHMEPGEKLDVLTGLGNGFGLEKCGAAPLLIGGGTGVSAMYGLCRALMQRGARVTAALGFASAGDAFYAEKFAALGAETLLYTMDGSAGVRGAVTDALSGGGWSYFYACGPLPMLRALDNAGIDGEYSMEARMGCGFGACMGCTIKTANGPRRVCRDGPVFEKGEIIWPTQR
jgi:dihydroorotate dehydrogenase electron transfer subunit